MIFKLISWKFEPKVKIYLFKSIQYIIWRLNNVFFYLCCSDCSARALCSTCAVFTVLRMRCVWPFCACIVYDRSAHALCMTVLCMLCVWPFCACVVYYLCCADHSAHALCMTVLHMRCVLPGLCWPFCPMRCVLPMLCWPFCACVVFDRSVHALCTTCAVLTVLCMRCVLPVLFWPLCACLLYYLCCSDRSAHAFCTTCAVLTALRRHCVLPVLFWPLCTCQAGHHDDKDEEGVLHNNLSVIKYFVISVGFLPHSRVTGCTVAGVHIKEYFSNVWLLVILLLLNFLFGSSENV